MSLWNNCHSITCYSNLLISRSVESQGPVLHLIHSYVRAWIRQYGEILTLVKKKSKPWTVVWATVCACMSYLDCDGDIPPACERTRNARSLQGVFSSYHQYANLIMHNKGRQPITLCIVKYLVYCGCLHHCAWLGSWTTLLSGDKNLKTTLSWNWGRVLELGSHAYLNSPLANLQLYSVLCLIHAAFAQVVSSLITYVLLFLLYFNLLLHFIIFYSVTTIMTIIPLKTSVAAQSTAVPTLKPELAHQAFWQEPHHDGCMDPAESLMPTESVDLWLEKWAELIKHHRRAKAGYTVRCKTIAMPNPNIVCEVHCNHPWEFRLALMGPNKVQTLDYTFASQIMWFGVKQLTSLGGYVCGSVGAIGSIQGVHR